MSVPRKDDWRKCLQTDKYENEEREKQGGNPPTMHWKKQKFTDQNPNDPSGSSGAAPAADLPVEEMSLSGCCEKKVLVIQ